MGIMFSMGLKNQPFQDIQLKQALQGVTLIKEPSRSSSYKAALTLVTLIKQALQDLTLIKQALQDLTLIKQAGITRPHTNKAGRHYKTSH
jgi:hypothetical protein